MSDLEAAIKYAAEKAVLRYLEDGKWIAPDYSNSFKLPQDMLLEIWAMVDIDKVKAAMVARIETELADRVIYSIAAEISEDIKKIMSTQKKRDAIRSFVKANLNTIMRMTQ